MAVAVLATTFGMHLANPTPAAAASGQLFGPIPQKFWGSFAPKVGANGTIVAYTTWLKNFDSGAPLGVHTVYIRDRSKAGPDTPAVVPISGPRPNGTSRVLAISSDPSSTFVLYRSTASNLVAGDTLGQEDAFVYNRLTNTTERVSVGDGEQQANGPVNSGTISADGRYVAFTSTATNMVSPASNGNAQVFVRDRQLGTTKQVSFGVGGAQANGDSFGVSISDNGRYVAFASAATNLVPGDTNNAPDVFVRDLSLNKTELISQGFEGAATGTSGFPSMSADGRFVAFDSTADDIVPGDENVASDVFVRDRLFGSTERVSVGPNGEEGFWDSWEPSMSRDGRFVAFESDTDEEFNPNDGNISTDVYVRDRLGRTITRASEKQNGTEAFGESFFPSISPEGKFVGFSSDSEEFACSGCDTNDSDDVFLKELPNSFVTNANLGSKYRSITPQRVLDTTSGAKLAGGATVDVQVTGGSTTVPTTATAVQLSVFASGETTAGATVTAYPTGVSRPPTAALHPVPGANVANQLAVKVGTGGKVRFYTDIGATHLTVDVVGYYAPDDGDAFTPIPSTMIVNTTGAEVPAGWPTAQPLAAGGSFARLDAQVAGVGDIPADARAVAINILQIWPTAANARVTAFPAGAANPGIPSSVAPAAGIVANSSVVPIGADGKISLAINAGLAHVIVTATGYFGPLGKNVFFALNPARSFDSRVASGTLAIPGHSGAVLAGEGVAVPVAGRAGIPSNAKAAALTTTTTNSTSAGVVMLLPHLGPFSFRLDLSQAPGVNRSNGNLIDVGPTGGVAFLNASAGPTHMFSDAYGYFR